MPDASLAFAATVTVPETIAFSAGLDMTTVGGVVSGGGGGGSSTITFRNGDVAVFPAPSLAIAFNVWEPSLSPEVFQLMLYVVPELGAVAVPMSTVSSR